MVAAEGGKAEAAEVLIRHGADVEALSETGDTPLHIAAFKGRIEVVQALLIAEADVSVVLGSDRGWSAPLAVEKERVKALMVARHGVGRGAGVAVDTRRYHV